MTSIGAVSSVVIICLLCVLPWMVGAALFLHRGVRLLRLRFERRPRPTRGPLRGAVALSGVIETRDQRLVDCEEVEHGAGSWLMARSPFGLRLASGELISVEPPDGWRRQARYSLVAPGEIAVVEGVILERNGGSSGGGAGGVYREPALPHRVLVASPSGDLRVVPNRPPPYMPVGPASYLIGSVVAFSAGAILFAFLLGGFCMRVWRGHETSAVVHALHHECSCGARSSGAGSEYVLDVTPDGAPRQKIVVERDDYLALVDGARVPVIIVPGAPALTQLGPQPGPAASFSSVILAITLTLFLAVPLVCHRHDVLPRWRSDRVV